MKTIFSKVLSTLPKWSRLLVLLYLAGFPIAMLGHYTHTFELFSWLGLVPERIWRGEVWRLITYPFLAMGIVDYVVSLFWLATLLGVLGRHWSASELWGYCLLATISGAVLLTLVTPHLPVIVIGNVAMIFGLLAAWYRLYGGERLILLGFGEISVTQAALLVAFIEVLITVFCLGPVATACMMAGGGVSWLYLVVRGKTAMNRRAQVADSERIARLEI